MKIKKITILGATGTIGVNTLDVIAAHPARFQVYALTANNRWQNLLQQCLIFAPTYAVLVEEQYAEILQQALRTAGSTTIVLAGMAALSAVCIADEVDMVMAAIVGAAGLPPTLAAAQAGKTILLANKETLVLAGDLFMQAVKQSGAKLLPIDSEHNAIFQSLPIDYTSPAQNGIRKIILTASGGPFRQFSAEQMQSVTVAQACKHPNWVMGQKISIDSASMMNKGLEVIEAHWLFNVSPAQIEVVVHPQSVIHSMVEYVDGSILAQLGSPDMRTPIAYAMAYPERIEVNVAPLDFVQLSQLTFEAPDLIKFPCLSLAFAALKQGGAAPAVLNAANEVAVSAFLTHQLGFMQIPQLIEQALSTFSSASAASIDDLLALDQVVRDFSQQSVLAFAKPSIR